MQTVDHREEQETYYKLRHRIAPESAEEGRAMAKAALRGEYPEETIEWAMAAYKAAKPVEEPRKFFLNGPPKRRHGSTVLLQPVHALCWNCTSRELFTLPVGTRLRAIGKYDEEHTTVAVIDEAGHPCAIELETKQGRVSGYQFMVPTGTV